MPSFYETQLESLAATNLTSFFFVLFSECLKVMVGPLGVT